MRRWLVVRMYFERDIKNMSCFLLLFGFCLGRLLNKESFFLMFSLSPQGLRSTRRQSGAAHDIKELVCIATVSGTLRIVPQILESF